MRHALLCVLAVLLTASGAAAQRRGGGTAAASGADRAAVDAAITDLQSQDLPTVLTAVTTLAEAADTRANRPLIELLGSGPPDDVTHAAIQALGAIASPDAVDVLTEYLRHRRARVRRLAVQSLALIVDARSRDEVNEALRSALHDSNDRVRAEAAKALGERGDRGALEVLFLAFERNVADAAVAIGKLGGQADAERLAGFLGRRQLSEILPGFDEFLRRSDVAEAVKIDIIRKLEGIAGPDVKRFLVNFVANPPAGLPARVRDEAQRVIRIIPDEV